MAARCSALSAAPLPSRETSLVRALAASKEEVFLPKLRQDVRLSAFSVSCVTDRGVASFSHHVQTTKAEFMHPRKHRKKQTDAEE